MKVLCINRNMYKVFLNKYYYQYNSETLNRYINKVLLFLKKVYNVEIYSIFNIKCYINDNYGIILEIEREYDPFSLFSKNTSLKIEIHDNSIFLYELEDYFITSDKKYIYNGKYYVKAVDDIHIIEHVNEVIYGSAVDMIVND